MSSVYVGILKKYVLPLAMECPSSVVDELASKSKSKQAKE